MATSVSARRVAYAKQLAEAVQKAVAVLSGLQGVERLSIFGSYARGRRDLLTDLDLLVVWEPSGIGAWGGPASEFGGYVTARAHARAVRGWEGPNVAFALEKSQKRRSMMPGT
jgi:hypothetical protein